MSITITFHRLTGDRVEAYAAAERQQGNAHMHQLAAARGQDWATMDDEARLALVDDLIHEERVPAAPLAEG